MDNIDLKIRQGKKNFDKEVELDGLDISATVKSLVLYMAADRITTAELELYPKKVELESKNNEITVDIEGKKYSLYPLDSEEIEEDELLEEE